MTDGYVFDFPPHILDSPVFRTMELWQIFTRL